MNVTAQMSDSTLRSNILSKIIAIIRREVNDPDLPITEITTASDVDGWDSLTHVQIIVAVEKDFRFRMKASEVAQLENVGSLINVVVARGVN
jgi:acyl carrier protein